jgi:hypothetical protein
MPSVMRSPRAVEAEPLVHDLRRAFGLSADTTNLMVINADDVVEAKA